MKIKAIAALLAGLALLSCSSQPDKTVPEGIISPDKMASIMVDINIVDAMHNVNSIRSEYSTAQIYRGVYEKHGITRKTFDSSMQYYARHHRKLASLYSQVKAELQKRENNLENMENNENED